MSIDRVNRRQNSGGTLRVSLLVQCEETDKYLVVRVIIPAVCLDDGVVEAAAVVEDLYGNRVYHRLVLGSRVSCQPLGRFRSQGARG